MSDYIVKVENVNGILVTTSNRVAEELGVEHRHLLEKIDGYIDKFTKAESSALVEEFYISSFYSVDENFKQYRNYLITKKGVAQLIGGYNAAVEKAFELNVAYINEFEKMENFIKENLVKRADINDIDETKKKNLEIRERYSKVKLAETLKSLIPYSNSEMYKEILVSETAKILTGKELLPPLRVQEKTLTATEIADIFDITPNMVGKIANANNLKTEEFGYWVYEKAAHCNKEVPNFRYFAKVIEEFKKYVKKPKGKK